MAASRPREFAVRALLSLRGDADFVEHRWESVPGWSSLAPVDQGLARELVSGVIRWERTLDWLIGQRSDGRPQKEMLAVLLRLGLYQLFWLDRIPAHAAVHESVQLARDLGFSAQSGFINAVLRHYTREMDSTRSRLLALRQSQPALGWSHPDWLSAGSRNGDPALTMKEISQNAIGKYFPGVLSFVSVRQLHSRILF